MKGSKKIGSSLAITASLGMLIAAAPAAFADTGTGTASATTTTSTQSGATNWNVSVASMTNDGVEAMSFFPNVITVDAGDSVTFNGAGHTVSFPGTDGKLPLSISPAALMPAGGATYDGSTFTSSGLLTGKPYTLTFSKPGVYPYYCLLHPGMMAVVIVNPAGTAYPMTQAQYDSLSKQEQQTDFDAGEKAVSQFQLKTKKNANGTTTYYAQNDVTEPQAYSFNLGSANNSSVSGSALIAFSAPPNQNMDITYNVTTKLAGLKPGATYKAMLTEGKSGSGVMVPGSTFANVTVNADGSGTVTGTVLAKGIPQGIWNLDICDATGKVIATATVDNPSFGYMRFLPGNLTIHNGDTVVWNETGTNEVHTVTFLPKGWDNMIPDSQKPIPFGWNPQTGGALYAGSGYLSSGFMTPNTSFAVTFVKTGDFAYRCLLHDIMGMIGNVNVVPAKGVSTLTYNHVVSNVPSKVYNGTTYLPLWYIQQLIKAANVTSTWDGNSLHMVTHSTVPAAHGNVGSGKTHFYLNGHLVQNVDKMVWMDPTTGLNTTWLPIYDLNLVLGSLGLHGSWDGNTWDLTPTAHAGSEPQVSGNSNPAGTPGGADSSAANGSGSGMSGMSMGNHS